MANNTSRLFVILYILCAVLLFGETAQGADVASGSIAVNVVWMDDNVVVDADTLSPGLDVDVSSADVSVANHSMLPLEVVMQGKSADGRLTVNSETPIIIVADGVTLASSSGPTLDLSSAISAVLVLRGENSLMRCSAFDEEKKVSACVQSSSALAIKGSGSLFISSPGCHGIKACGDIHIEGCALDVDGTGADGITAFGNIFSTAGNMRFRNCTKNAIHAEKGYVIVGDSDIEISASAPKSNGVRCSGALIATDSKFTLSLGGDESKGIKSGSSAIFRNCSFSGTATGNMTLKKFNPSYCTFVKAGGDLILNGSTFNLTHTGSGGRGISANGDLAYVDSRLSADFDCAGGMYRNAQKDMCYYTSRVLNSKRNMDIASGEISITQHGCGGKGISCSGDMKIGLSGSCDKSEPSIFIETMGEAIVNDTIFDERYGCPKAIKSKRNLHILGGNIRAVTHGVGGEGIECGRYMKILDGIVQCVTYDDGINVGKGIKFNGGIVYAYSSDNDAIDSNGNIEIQGGIVVAVSSHERDEDFDCDPDFDFTIAGGTVLGVAADYSRPTQAGVPYLQHTPLLWAPDHTEKVVIDRHDLAAGTYVTIADARRRPVISTILPQAIPAAYITSTFPGLADGAKAYVYFTPAPPRGADAALPGKIFLGGASPDTAPGIILRATTEILDIFVH